MDPVLLLYSAQQDAVHIVVVQMMKVMACHCNHFDRYLLGTQVSCMGCTVYFEYSYPGIQVPYHLAAFTRCDQIIQ